MKKRRLIFFAILTFVLVGAAIISVQKQNIFLHGTQQREQLSTKEKQLSYLKKHKNKIDNFVKSQNSKIESVQIDWDETKWEKVGNGTPQGGGEIVNVYGSFNHIESSSWNVTFDIENDKIIPNSMALAKYLRVEGRVFD